MEFVGVLRREKYVVAVGVGKLVGFEHLAERSLDKRHGGLDVVGEAHDSAETVVEPSLVDAVAEILKQDVDDAGGNGCVDQQRPSR